MSTAFVKSFICTSKFLIYVNFMQYVSNFWNKYQESPKKIPWNTKSKQTSYFLLKARFHHLYLHK